MQEKRAMTKVERGGIEKNGDNCRESRRKFPDEDKDVKTGVKNIDKEICRRKEMHGRRYFRKIQKKSEGIYVIILM